MRPCQARWAQKRLRQVLSPVGPPRGPKHVSDIEAVFPELPGKLTGQLPRCRELHTTHASAKSRGASRSSQVHTHRGVRLCRWAKLTTPALQALGRAGSRPRTPKGAPTGPVGAAKERRMEESACCRLGPHIFLRHELAPHTSLCRFFRVWGQIQFKSNRESRESHLAIHIKSGDLLFHQYWNAKWLFVVAPKM